ncbi:MAG: tRNA (adenosine(37)-N6)-threonylcarbamoyltransferase complex dimerization subunit type 1 TsaB [Bacteroidales bacterium]
MKSRILAIETSEEYCSVALFNGKNLIEQQIDNELRNHSQMLTVLINSILSKNDFSVSLIDAVAISQGPGSYTGLRIGTSVAKGLCYAIGKPLIAVNTLEVLCYAALADVSVKKQLSDTCLLCPMIDARRMEVYMQLFDSSVRPFSEIEAKIIASETFNELLKDRKMIFFGSGADKVEFMCKSPNAIFLKNIRPLARFMIEPAYVAYENQRFVDVAYFEPYYLKNFVTTRSSRSLLGN